jgi:hypothetical protein
MKSKKKVVILTESQVKSLMDNLKVERDKRIIEEVKKNQSR